MLKQAAIDLRANRITDAALAAPRQIWLAGLGAAIVTREWARNDAAHVFRTLVKEGSNVETRAMRSLGRQIESSIVLASTAWNRARDVAQGRVNRLVDSAVAALPSFNTPIAVKRAAKKPRAAVKRATSRKARRTKRSA